MPVECQVATAEPAGGIFIATYAFIDVPRAGDEIVLPAGSPGQSRSYVIKSVRFVASGVEGVDPSVTLYVDAPKPVRPVLPVETLAT
jgi:hypothetical protein